MSLSRIGRAWVHEFQHSIAENFPRTRHLSSPAAKNRRSVPASLALLVPRVGYWGLGPIEEGNGIAQRCHTQLFRQLTSVRQCGHSWPRFPMRSMTFGGKFHLFSTR